MGNSPPYLQNKVSLYWETDSVCHRGLTSGYLISKEFKNSEYFPGQKLMSFHVGMRSSLNIVQFLTRIAQTLSERDRHAGEGRKG